MEFSLKSWLMATRPKTLTASFVPIFAATLLAYREQHRVDWILSLYAFLVAIFIQIGTNLVNDALDFKKGVDTSERLGFARVTQSGLLSYQQVLTGAALSFVLALGFGIPLMVQGGWPIACLLVISVLLGYCYTGGPYPLGFHGLGDFFAFLFFGFAATGAVFYLQTGILTPSSMMAGAQVGLLATLMSAINNLRDVVSDAKAYKMTLPVRFGISFGKKEIALLVYLPFLLNVFWFSQQAFAAGFLPLLVFPLGWRIVREIMAKEPGREYNQFFGQAALLQLTFGTLLGLGFLLGS